MISAKQCKAKGGKIKKGKCIPTKKHEGMIDGMNVVLTEQEFRRARIRYNKLFK